MSIDVFKGSSLDVFFSQKVKELDCKESTQSYITQIFSRPKSELIDKSVTILYSEAKFSYSFEQYQNLADWILFAKSLYPEHLNDASEDYYYAIAQNSYYKCYLIMQKKWIIFEELADKFPYLVKHLHGLFRSPEVRFL